MKNYIETDVCDNLLDLKRIFYLTKLSNHIFHIFLLKKEFYFLILKIVYFKIIKVNIRTVVAN